MQWEKRSAPGCILKTELRRIVTGLDVGYEEKIGVKDHSSVLGWGN